MRLFGINTSCPRYPLQHGVCAGTVVAGIIRVCALQRDITQRSLLGRTMMEVQTAGPVMKTDPAIYRWEGTRRSMRRTLSSTSSTTTTVSVAACCASCMPLGYAAVGYSCAGAFLLALRGRSRLGMYSARHHHARPQWHRLAARADAARIRAAHHSSSRRVTMS